MQNGTKIMYFLNVQFFLNFYLLTGIQRTKSVAKTKKDKLTFEIISFIYQIKSAFVLFLFSKVLFL